MNAGFERMMQKAAVACLKVVLYMKELRNATENLLWYPVFGCSVEL
jgi:hypothetical protein